MKLVVNILDNELRSSKARINFSKKNWSCHKTYVRFTLCILSETVYSSLIYEFLFLYSSLYFDLLESSAYLLLFM